MPGAPLTEQDAYHTPPGRGGPIARRFPTVFFYLRIAGIVRRASVLARRGLYDDARWIESSLATVRALEAVGGRFAIEGLSFVRGLAAPAVFIANHMSILETFVLPCLIVPHRPLTFVIKESLVTYPWFGHVMRSRDPIVVGRENAREDLKIVLEEGRKRLADGVSVVIFPQTTRASGFDPRQFNTLGVKLAGRCAAPAVPVALKTDAWGLGKRLKDFGPVSPQKTVHIRFGAPLSVAGGGKEEHARIVSFIGGEMAGWRD
ncbi:MAG: lysophospholipid acyltransferase family protein [Desulfobacterales bacterium]